MKTMKKIVCALMTLVLLLSSVPAVFADEADIKTIAQDTACSLTVWKFDYTNAKKDGVWDEDAFPSTGWQESYVENALVNTNRKGDTDGQNGNVLGNGQTSKGYAIAGVEFTYLKVADITTFQNQETTQVLYGFHKTDAANLLKAIGLENGADRCAEADSLDADRCFYTSDTLNKALSQSLEANSTTVKNALETFIRNGGTAMDPTSEVGKTSAKNLPVGLYLLVETKVPEMVTSTTNPFFVSLPMTTVTGNDNSASQNGGTAWNYDVVVYPKQETGIPTLEKTVRESKADTGKNEGSASVTDGFAHTATGSAGDTMEYQIVSTLPTITSQATALSTYNFYDTLCEGLAYDKDAGVTVAFFTDAACTDKVATWSQDSGKFTVTYSEDGRHMTVDITKAGLDEINGSTANKNGKLYTGYSNYTARVTYSAVINSDNSFAYGEKGNENTVILTWKRTSGDYYDTLIDDCHVFSFGLDLTKLFSDVDAETAAETKLYDSVKFKIQNKTDGTWIIAKRNDAEGVYYVTGHTDQEADATVFTPVTMGKSCGHIMVKGLEEDTYTITETQTANGYTLLKNAITVTISLKENTANTCKRNIKVHYSTYTGEWNIEGKSLDKTNVRSDSTFGTERINAYRIIEETLNLRDVRIFDYKYDRDGRRIAILNAKQTAIAQGKQEQIKQEFADWIWADPNRRERLTALYNEKFNSIRPREYDGSHLNFVGINPEIALRPHQVNAIAHILYGGNTLLAHTVGAGKTFEMVAAAQESKRLGLCQKSLFVVPNHLTEQWASEYLQLYPAANILVATKKDFETKNRKRFCSRIATGDYDAIIVGHSQFEKIPMSPERQRFILEQQKQEILDGIQELKRNNGDNFSVKQLERSKKSIQQKLERLNDQSRKDDVITFEELGVDRIFVDEAHMFKNLAAFTKMRNVAGISQTEAQKSSDLYMKCRYLDELTGGRGVVFATGTPISNSMVELYTMQKYLQYHTLKEKGLLHFDAWASTFGETVTAIELAPEGTGYRSKTRFAKFFNLPELMSMFKEIADIQTADMLKLPVPEAEYHNVVLQPSEQQKKIVASLSERAEKVRNKQVDSNEDNMLVITNDGRKLALDQRLINPMLPDSDTGKVAVCTENVYKIWERTAEKKSTQMVFVDLSTPHNDGQFNVYDDLKKKLLDKGIPESEIAYIHDAKTEAAKKELFGKVRSGEIRVLIGSTQKMGAGTNAQRKLIALHHMDCPWRPSDLQQREGRIIRQGNENPKVDIYTYVTENTFDSYLYQLVEGKQKFIGQIMTSKSPVRSAEDIDETALSYAEIKALCSGNPQIKEKMDLDIEVQKLKLLRSNHMSQRYALEDKLIHSFPMQIASTRQMIDGLRSDMVLLKENTRPNKDGFSPMVIDGHTLTEKKAAGTALLDACNTMTGTNPIPLGSYRGFQMTLCFDSFEKLFKISLQGALTYKVSLGTDVFGNIQRIDNLLESMPTQQIEYKEKLKNLEIQVENAKQEVAKPFSREAELKEKSARLDHLNILLNMDKRENEIVDGVQDEGEIQPQRESRNLER